MRRTIVSGAVATNANAVRASTSSANAPKSTSGASQPST